jgi:hypothetical protein
MYLNVLGVHVVGMRLSSTDEPTVTAPEHFGGGLAPRNKAPQTEQCWFLRVCTVLPDTGSRDVDLSLYRARSFHQSIDIDRRSRNACGYIQSVGAAEDLRLMQ